MPNGSVLTATSLTERTPRFRLGSRCSRCRRHLFYRHRPLPDGAATWSHESCDVDAPTDAELQALAEDLVGRSTELRSEWAAITRDARALTDADADADESLRVRQADFHRRLTRMVSARTCELRAEWVTH